MKFGWTVNLLSEEKMFEIVDDDNDDNGPLVSFKLNYEPLAQVS